LSCPCGSAVDFAATAIVVAAAAVAAAAAATIAQVARSSALPAATSTAARARRVGKSQFATRIRSGKKQLRKWVS